MATDLGYCFESSPASDCKLPEPLGSATSMSLIFTDPSHGVLTMGPTQIPISRFQLF